MDIPARVNELLTSASAKFVAAVAACAVTLALVNESQAAIILHVPSVSVTEGNSSFFDVFFEITSGNPQLGGYQVGLILSGPSADVQFTGVGVATNAVFPSNTPALNSGTTLPDVVVKSNDFLLSPPELPIVNGAGLLRVNFITTLGDAGSYTVSFDANETFLSNGAGQLLAAELSGGTIEVRPIPEPSGIALAGLAIIGLWTSYFRRKRRFRMSG